MGPSISGMAETTDLRGAQVWHALLRDNRCMQPVSLSEGDTQLQARTMTLGNLGLCIPAAYTHAKHLLSAWPYSRLNYINLKMYFEKR